MLRPIALYRSWTSALYSTVFLVQSNSGFHVSIVFSPSGLAKMQPAPAPSLDLDPSKNNFQNKDLTASLSTKFTHLKVFVWEKNRF